MRTKFTLILLVCILVGCAKNADIESVNVPVEPASQTVLPKISKDISVLSADDAIKVANLFAHGNVLTKSETLKDVRNVVPIKDASDRTLMYAVNYDDGYTIVSATKNYHPVLAVVDHGTYTGEKTGTGQDVLMNEYMVATEAAMDGEITIEGNPWSVYEEVPFEVPAQTKVSDEYYDVVNQYTSEWYNAGYNIYYLNQQPENMPDDIYAEFCDYARDYDRPDHDYMQCSFIVENDAPYMVRHECFLQTSWGQKEAYNDGLEADLPLGCTTIAIGQIMKYLEYPSSINWDAMPNWLGENQVNECLTDFLKTLRERIGVDQYGGATICEVKEALSTYYGYNSLSIINHAQPSVKASLAQGIPVYMRGVDANLNEGHAWVCDGYYTTHPQTEYKLYVIPMGGGTITSLTNIHSVIVYPESFTVFNYFHMNWGWYGNNNGYFYQDNVSVNSTNFNVDRKNLIIDAI